MPQTIALRHALSATLLALLSATAIARDNPLLQTSTLPLQYPRFDQFQDADFGPALEAGMALHWREVQAIVQNPAAPTFENTILALERSGRLLSRTAAIFFNLSGADSNAERLALQQRFAPLFAAHRDRIALEPRLFARVDALYKQRESLKLDAQDRRLLERQHLQLVRAGALLDAAGQDRLRAINGEMAVLGAQFNQRVLQGVNAAALRVKDRAELAGLGEAEIDALKTPEGDYRIALQNTSGQPLLERLQNRALRERLHRASLERNAGGPFDTTALLSRVLRLRAERAALLGYATHADYVLADETAKDVGTVNTLLRQLAPSAVASAAREQKDLQALADREQDAAGQPRFSLQAWDWAYYAERLRSQQFGVDANQLRDYLELNTVLERGVFHAASGMYGLRFKPRPDLPTYHPDVKAWQVDFPDGQQAFVLLDLYARPSKRGGAWANGYIGQNRLMGTRPVLGLHLNIPKPKAGEPTLLTWDEVNTLFHEFGHNLHALLADLRVPSQQGVPRDFVEFPSQVNEMWQVWPSVLANYARHYKTGATMPKDLLDKLQATRRFNQGYLTTEYLSATLLDQRLHQLKAEQVPAPEQLMAFEAKVLEEEGFGSKTLVPPRYRTPYFSHIVGGYSAGYYAYLWSEVLDANTVEWIEQHGGLDRRTGEHVRKHLLSRGGSEDALTLFQGLVGHKPELSPYLKRRGLSLQP